MKKNKIIFIVLLTFFLGGCTHLNYLPYSNEIDVNENGSFIKILTKNELKGEVAGELLAADSDKIYVLTNTDIDTLKKCTIISADEIVTYKLRYAETKDYGWTIPLALLLPVVHGYYSVVTVPLNVFVTIAVTAAARESFQYSNKKISYGELKKFARFPQGIPKNIDIEKIR